MLFQNVAIGVVLAANFTLEGLGDLVLLDMVIQVTLRHKTFATFLKFTQKWLLSRMNSHVCYEISIFCKHFCANFALERFLAAVNSNMNFETCGSLVELFANGALERLFSGMDHLMRFEMSSRNELLLAILKITKERPVSVV